MHYAVLDNNTNSIVNVIVWDKVSEYNVDDGHSLIKLSEEAEAWIGWTLIDGIWVSPEEAE